MKPAALRSFVEEYESIQKAAGIKEIGDAVKKLPGSLKIENQAGGFYDYCTPESAFLLVRPKQHRGLFA